jgi:hypothetical protein
MSARPGARLTEGNPDNFSTCTACTHADGSGVTRCDVAGA